MFHLLKLIAPVLLSHYNIVDQKSCRTFLLELVLLGKSFALKADTKLDDADLKHTEFVLNDDALFDYVYGLIAEQLRTEEILFESVDDAIIIALVENKMSENPESPEAINPAVIISFITQIISIINTIKHK